jgi:DNA-binding transcriptional MerR regulator
LLVRYRVDELAARSGVSVDTVRFYQGKGLLNPPSRQGRIAWYSDEHHDKLRRVRDLRRRGFTLASIRALLAGDVEEADEALVTALVNAAPGDEGVGGWLTREELSRRTGVSPELLAAIEREGLLVPQVREGPARYSESDARAVSAGLRLLEAGVPLAELLLLARAHDQAMRQIAQRAVDLFLTHVRRPLLASTSPGEDRARRLVDAFDLMFPATTSLVAHHFGRVLLATAVERLEQEGSAVEITARHGSPGERLER